MAIKNLADKDYIETNRLIIRNMKQNLFAPLHPTTDKFFANHNPLSEKNLKNKATGAHPV